MKLTLRLAKRPQTCSASNVATRIRDEFGIEAVQALAGHASPSMTADCASNMDGLAVKVAAKIG